MSDYQVPDELLLLGLIDAENDGRDQLADFNADIVEWLRDALAAVLPAHEAIVRAHLTPQQAAEAVGQAWIVTPRTTWNALTASCEQIEREVRAKIAEEIRVLYPPDYVPADRLCERIRGDQ